jgi:nitrous oxidase accessory protein
MGAALAGAIWLAAVPAVMGATSPSDLDVQVLLDAAAAGSTVQIPAGMHRGPVVIDRTLQVVGAPGAAIDGGGVGSVVTIAAPGVELSGLTISGSERNPVGAPSGVLIQREGAGAWVHDVAIHDTYIGITVQRAPDVLLERVDIRGSGIVTGEMHVAGEGGAGEVTAQLRGDGIWVYDAPRATIRDCALHTVRDGVYLAYGDGALIEDNVIEDSRYAVHDMYATDPQIVGNTLRGNLSGFVLMYGGPVRIAGNTVTESGSPSTGYGVLVKDAGGVTLAENVFADNRVGMLIDDAGRTGVDATMVRSNTIAANQIGVMLVPSADPTFTGNAFIQNTTQVALGGAGVTQAVWTAGGVGNHWSDYAGFDADGDGTGDLAYTRSGRTSRLVAEGRLLLALASGPAFRLLSAVEDKWAPGDPLVRDVAPLMSATTPPIDADRPGSSAPLWVPGLALLTVCVVALLGGVRRRA